MTQDHYGVVDGRLAPLLDAGAVLAKLADPLRDLMSFGGDFREIALTLKGIGNGLDRAYERASERYIATECRTAADVERATRRQADEERASLVTATRTAKRALIDLAALLGEMEAQLPESQP
jgi:hypothetical protein